MVLGLYSMCTLKINAVLIISQVPKQHCGHGALRIVFVLLRCIWVSSPVRDKIPPRSAFLETPGIGTVTCISLATQVRIS